MERMMSANMFRTKKELTFHLMRHRRYMGGNGVIVNVSDLGPGEEVPLCEPAEVGGAGVDCSQAPEIVVTRHDRSAHTTENTTIPVSSHITHLGKFPQPVSQYLG